MNPSTLQNAPKHILCLAGDGIGSEVMAETIRVLQKISDTSDLKMEFSHALAGGCAIDAEGVPVSDTTIAKAKAADAVLLGAVGGPKWDTVDYAIRPEAGLLRLRKDLQLFANLRPALVLDALVDASTLKPEVVKGLDILIVRELTGGVYFGEPRGIETLPDGQQRGINTQVYTTSEIERVARVAFDLARTRSGRVCSAEKANVMESGKLWRQVISALHTRENYTDVELSHMYADNCSMQLVRWPKQFDVIVTDNLFGDLLSDTAAMLTGSLGMLPSASLGATDPVTGKRPALYEPVHGSAPDIAGTGKANPLATILSASMMLQYSFGRGDLAERIQRAVTKVLGQGIRTADIAESGQKPVSTQAMGDAILENL